MNGLGTLYFAVLMPYLPVKTETSDGDAQLLL